MPLQATSGAASYDGFGGGVVAEPNYIESCFSTYLYTGNGSSQTITNGIDLSTKGGLVWIKSRSLDPSNHQLLDTARGANNFLMTNSTSADQNNTSINWAFNSTGFSQNNNFGSLNRLGDTYVSWTFRKAPKFFDVVTYTGNGDSNRNIAHSLGSVPGCIIVKETDAANGWAVYHRTLSDGDALQLQSTGAVASTNFFGPNSAQTATVFQTGSANITYTNGVDKTYVAYLFAHNAGGFGLTGTDNVISCGSFTTDGSSNATVNLGYEPQFIIYKNSGAAQSWNMFDTMRGFDNSGGRLLNPNSSGAESGYPYGFLPTSTGFEATNGLLDASSTYIYIAIRRGPMKVPTSGTSVFDVDLTGNTSVPSFTSAFPVDMAFWATRNSVENKTIASRLTGINWMWTNATDGEYSGPNYTWDYQKGWGAWTNLTTETSWNFRRAPSFFDEVCYTGNNTAGTTLVHNLGVAPELMIIKSRNEVQAWNVFSSFGSTSCLFTNLDTTNAATTSTYGSGSGFEPLSAAPTASVINISSANQLNKTSRTYVSYLFATCPGVSKVGSYTGTGATQTISCGFTGGARFVLVKRTDSTGDWYVWDTARGMVAGTDPSLLLNSTAAQVNANSIYTTTGGFQIVSTAAGINASGGTYIFLAIA